MGHEKAQTRALLRGIAPALVGAACLLMPTSKNYYSQRYWLNRLFPDANQLVLRLLSARIFWLEPLFWGALTFFALGCAEAWPGGKRAGPRLSRAGRIALGIAAAVLTAALLYWLGGMYRMVVLPPMPFETGYWLMNHRAVFGALWCLDAVLWHCSVRGKP